MLEIEKFSNVGIGEGTKFLQKGQHPHDQTSPLSNRHIVKDSDVTI